MSAGTATRTTTRRVLVAEDNQGMRGLVHQLIDLEDGLEVVGEATDGEQALRLAAALEPDAVVLDLGLPVIDGEVALERLRRDHAGLQIVVLSGQASALVQPRLRSKGADAVIEKGVPRWEATLLSELESTS